MRSNELFSECGLENVQDLAIVKFVLPDQLCSRAHHGSTVRDIGITTTDLTKRVEKRLIEIKFSILAPSGTKLKHKQTRVKKKPCFYLMNLGFSTPFSMTFTGKFWAKISPEPVCQSSFLTKLWAKTDVSPKKKN